MKRKTWHATLLLLMPLFAGGAGFVFLAQSRGGEAAQELDYAALTGSVFQPAPANPLRAPQFQELPLPAITDSQAIWGSTGRDTRGHIWLGVSMGKYGTGAHLIEFDPAAGSARDHGSVLDQLRRLGLAADGIGQVKIHSKIIQAPDGWLYFASTDEEGEDPAKNIYPRGGAHLWRIHPERGTWEHLFSAPPGIVAVSGVGRMVYALGYWDHILFQYDTNTGQRRQVTVGSAEGHVSRNFLADSRGHAFVPRVTRRGNSGFDAALVEYDENLKEIAATPLQYYLDAGSPEPNHGITALLYLPDQRLLFATHRGQLYEIAPPASGPSKISALGWINPRGEAYAPSLFYLGGTWIGAVTLRGIEHEWIVRSLEPSRTTRAFPLDPSPARSVLMYGSVTQDDTGRAYVVGWADSGRGSQRPYAARITAAR